MIAFKPADDGDGFVVTLYNPGKSTDSFSLKPNKGSKVWKCDTGENKSGEIKTAVELPGQEVIMVRF